NEHEGRYSLRIDSSDGKMHVNLIARETQIFPKTSIFGSLEKASAFFEAGSVGYSPATKEREFDGLELRSRNWKVEPLDVEQVESSFFDDHSVFPRGSVQFDC